MKVWFKRISKFLIVTICITMLSGCNNKNKVISTEGAISSKNILIEDNEKQYINIKEFLEKREIEKLTLETSDTYIINPKQIVSIDSQSEILIINGEEIELKNIDYIKKDDQLYINLDLYSRLFEEDIHTNSKGEIIDVEKKFNYLTPDELTIYDYFSGSYDKESFGMRYNENYRSANDSKIKIISEEEANENTHINRFDGVNEIILKGYNRAAVFYDIFNQFQVYNWGVAIEKSNVMGAYGLVSNLTSILQSVMDLEVINEINAINEFTEKDLEYINRIDTIISAIPVGYIQDISSFIGKFSSKLSEYEDGGTGQKEIYRAAVIEAEDMYEEAINTYVNLKLPSFSKSLPIVSELRNIKNVKNSKDMEEEAKIILKEIINLIENNQYENLNNANKDINELIEELPEQWREKLNPLKEDLVMYLPSLIELVDKKGNIDIESFTESLGALNTSYNNMIEAIGIVKNLFTILDTVDYENYNFASSIDTGKAKAVVGLFDTVLSVPEGAASVFGVTYLSVALSVLEEIGDSVERLANTVSGMLFMALSDKIYDIDAVFNNEISVEEYIY